MGLKQDILIYLSELKNSLEQEMPKVCKEIRLYEEKRTKGQLTEKPCTELRRRIIQFIYTAL
jgi:hypothetical protein